MISRFPIQFRFSDTMSMEPAAPALSAGADESLTVIPEQANQEKPVRVRAHRRKLPRQAGNQDHGQFQASSANDKSIVQLLAESLSLAHAFTDRLPKDAGPWGFITMEELKKDHPDHVIVSNVFGSSSMFFACLKPDSELVIVTTSA